MASGQSEAAGNTMKPLLPVPSHSIPRSQSFPSLAIAPWNLEVGVSLRPQKTEMIVLGVQLVQLLDPAGSMSGSSELIQGLGTLLPEIPLQPYPFCEHGMSASLNGTLFPTVF